uniref:SURF1-like protein n=1 Tax=Phenylobacterium glaciei TaxID=2803784 RepID=A0A974S9Y4_9CAUL|nr:SURF1 family protein [Phenylobacterium glaciei]
MAWKTALIAQIEARIHAPASPAPGPAQWPSVTRERDQYRHVVVQGVFQHDRETMTQAVTAAGPGFWVMTPLRTDAGFTILVNRGFVPSRLRAGESRPLGLVRGEQRVTGLLRITEPRGGFLRANDPERDAWRSRDVHAIAARRGLREAAPILSTPMRHPIPAAGRGGMTVVRFPNSHLVYAITWFALALGVAVALGVAQRAQRRGDAP